MLRESKLKLVCRAIILISYHRVKSRPEPGTAKLGGTNLPTKRNSASIKLTSQQPPRILHNHCLNKANTFWKFRD
jgi:hypothetical protein